MSYSPEAPSSAWSITHERTSNGQGPCRRQPATPNTASPTTATPSIPCSLSSCNFPNCPINLHAGVNYACCRRTMHRHMLCEKKELANELLEAVYRSRVYFGCYEHPDRIHHLIKDYKAKTATMCQFWSDLANRLGKPEYLSDPQVYWPALYYVGCCGPSRIVERVTDEEVEKGCLDSPSDEETNKATRAR
ncbi:hypothetical protein FRC08_006043 [Ceratobasidium sp. 394]|nr:hypothetical protein FRC08_006043 [Ceratobasidium sp. 394]